MSINLYILSKKQTIWILIFRTTLQKFIFKKKKGIFIILLLQIHKTYRFEIIIEEIGSSGLSFASEERLRNIWDLKLPASPFGLINDIRKVIVLTIEN